MKLKQMTPEMKRDFKQRRINADIYERMHAMKRTKFPEPKNRKVLILPEEFTGGDLKRVKKLIKNRKK